MVNRWFCSPIGLHRISLARASKDMPKTAVFDRLDDKRDTYSMGEPICRRPVMPVPAPPRRPAVRRLHHQADGVFRPNLRLRKSKMGGSSIFKVEERS